LVTMEIKDLEVIFVLIFFFRFVYGNIYFSLSSMDPWSKNFIRDVMPTGLFNL
jgi:hypothetical protein